MTAEAAARNRVVITGASRGLGNALAHAYRARGCEVWGGCRIPGRATDLGSSGVNVCRLDVTDEELVRRFAAEVSAAGPVDVLVNAAGIDARSWGAPPDRRGPFDLSAEHFLEEVRVNALGPMLVTRALLPQLIEGRPGKVINLSSRVASAPVGAEVCWDIGYNASKAALNAVTVRTARLVADSGLVVVSVHPGWIRTDMGGAGADLEPGEAAEQLVLMIERLGPTDNGLFLRADGSPHPF